MRLKTRVEKIERHVGLHGGEEVGAVIVCTVAPKFDADGNLAQDHLAEADRKPAFANILFGPLTGQQVTSDEGETLNEFRARIDRIVEDTA